MPEHTWQPDGVAGIDTRISEANPTTNYGNFTTLTLGYSDTGKNDDLLFLYDLTLIPLGSTIVEATLSLWLDYTNPSVGPALLHIRRILAGNSDWTELGATYNHKYGTTDWAGGHGCEIEGVDFSTEEILNTWDVINNTGIPKWIHFYLIPEAFQSLIDVANYGFKLYSSYRDPDVYRWGRFYSSENADAVHRPMLYVRWIEPAGRLVEYTFNVWDPMKRILDSQGREVPPNEVRPDNWISVDGIALPTSQVYPTLVEDPTKSYIVEVSYSKGGLNIKANRNEFADIIISRAAGA